MTVAGFRLCGLPPQTRRRTVARKFGSCNRTSRKVPNGTKLPEKRTSCGFFPCRRAPGRLRYSALARNSLAWVPCRRSWRPGHVGVAFARNQCLADRQPGAGRNRGGDGLPQFRPRHRSGRHSPDTLRQASPRALWRVCSLAQCVAVSAVSFNLWAILRPALDRAPSRLGPTPTLEWRSAMRQSFPAMSPMMRSVRTGSSTQPTMPGSALRSDHGNIWLQPECERSKKVFRLFVPPTPEFPLWSTPTVGRWLCSNLERQA